MRNTRSVLLSLAASAMLASTAVYADGKALCEKWVGDYHDVHCTYVSGLAVESTKGRYIKHYDSQNDSSLTRCVTADTVEDDIYQEIAAAYLGSRTVHYSICTDASGENCEALGTDAYTVARSGETFIGTPPLYALDLSAVKDKYPECEGPVNKLGRRLERPTK